MSSSNPPLPDTRERFLRDCLVVYSGSEECLTNAYCVRALQVLQSWDGLCAADSVGALLFDRFRGEYLGGEVWEVPFDLADPIETPFGIPVSEAGAAVQALIVVAMQMEDEDGQRLDKPWGEFKKLPVDINGIEWGACVPTN